MLTQYIDLTKGQTQFTTDQTELIEKVNCLEFETSQLNRAYQLWGSCAEQGTTPDWMAAAIRVTYDALLTFYLDVSTILADVPDTFSTRHLAQLGIIGILGDEGTTSESSRELLRMTEPFRSAQAELIGKASCLEFETSQLNRAYQQWRSYVEQGTAPDWMAVAISTSYDVLITFCVEVSTILADDPHALPARHLAQLDISGILEAESRTAEPSPAALPMTQSDWSERAMPAAISAPSTDDAISDEQGQEEEKADLPPALSARRLSPLEISAILGEESTTAGTSRKLLPPMQPDWSEPAMPTAGSLRSNGDGIWEQGAIQADQEEEEADVPHAFSTRRLTRLEISRATQEENTNAEPSPELPMFESEPMIQPESISPALAGEAIWEQSVIQLSEQVEMAGAEPVAAPSLATLAKWLQGSSTEMLFFIPPGTLGKLVRATSLAVLTVAGGMIAIYVATAGRTQSSSASQPVQNSASQAAAGVVVTIPTAAKAGFKFDPDPVVASLGRSFAVNAVLSRGSDISSMAIQIDYDANLLQFMGVSPGGFLKEGQNAGFVLMQRDDPATGVLRISAEKSPGTPGISGDGPVFVLSFKARKRGKATVSIVPGAHDSQGRRIDMAGSQVSVRVN